MLDFIIFNSVMTFGLISSFIIIYGSFVVMNNEFETRTDSVQ
jgi:hypothetical protein